MLTQIGNQKSQVEGQTVQWPTERDKKKQITIHKTLSIKIKQYDNTTPQKTDGKLVCSGKVGCLSST
jgi:hypothetical protein